MTDLSIATVKYVAELEAVVFTSSLIYTMHDSLPLNMIWRLLRTGSRSWTFHGLDFGFRGGGRAI
jgi:hypothetical protein